MGQAESIDKIFSDAIREMEAAWKRERDARAASAGDPQTILDMRKETPMMPAGDADPLDAESRNAEPLDAASNPPAAAPDDLPADFPDSSPASLEGLDPEPTLNAEDATDAEPEPEPETNPEAEPDATMDGSPAEPFPDMDMDVNPDPDPDADADANPEVGSDAEWEPEEPPQVDPDDGFTPTGDVDLDALITSVMSDANPDEEEDGEDVGGDAFGDMDEMLSEILGSDDADALEEVEDAALEAEAVTEPAAEPEAEAASTSDDLPNETGEVPEEGLFHIRPLDGESDEDAPDDAASVDTLDEEDGAAPEDGDSLDDFLTQFGEDEDSEGDVPIIPVPVTDVSRQESLEANVADEEEARRILHSIHKVIPPASHSAPSGTEKGLDAALSRCAADASGSSGLVDAECLPDAGASDDASGFETPDTLDHENPDLDIHALLRACGIGEGECAATDDRVKSALLAVLVKRHVRLLQKCIAKLPTDRLGEDAPLRAHLDLELEAPSLLSSATDEFHFPLSDAPSSS